MKSAVWTANAVGEWFSVKTGVRQSCVLSPLLFILLMDHVLKQATAQVEADGHSDTFAYADDVCLVTHTQETLDCLVQCTYR